MIALHRAAAVLLAPLLAVAAAAAVAGGLSDPQIVGILQASDEAAWQAATRAVERLAPSTPGSRRTDPEVAAFANLVIADRLTEMRKLRELGIRSLDSAERERLVRVDKESDARLKSLEGPALDRVFVDGAASSLAASLDDIDHRLLAAADDADLRAHLRERRYLIETHLERARTLKASLTGR